MYIYTDSSRARACVCVFFYASSSAIIIEKEAFGKKRRAASALARVVSFLRSLAPSAISTARLFFLFLWARVSSRVREKNIIKDAFFQATQNRQRMYTYTHRR
jgi:hypothetical protein